MQLKATAQQVADELNKLRANPLSFVPDLEKMLSQFKGQVLHVPGEIALRTNEGPSAVQECIQALKNQSPLPALQYDYDIEKAAKDHANDIGPKGLCDHTGSDGSSMSKRMDRYGQWGGHIGECIDFGNHSARTVIISLIVDDGVPSRGHRKNCLSVNFKKVGIAVAQHTQYGMTTVFDFAETYSKKGTQVGGNIQQQQQYQGNIKPQLNYNYSSGSGNGSTTGSNNSLYNQQKQGNSDMPPGCVGKKTQTQTTISGQTKTVKTTTVYTMKDGSTRTETKTQTTTTG
ncbi:CAP domain [Pseudocohnilembus persalinus]|uniref:CAP domain n=1 Tax=Pseudocohnilembus persalinus TaxID=266149 RepID=A0A0V0R3R4_PSEPJ|nr:CAP domain [Pseudocohnilembus persalinus]|eukprot:KRX09133.1 CAP domain [Pseudocohnilembus persalinus]